MVSFSLKNVSKKFEGRKGDVLALEGIELPLEIRSVIGIDKTRMVAEILKSFNIEQQIHRYIYQLSGGQGQLVALCRALVFDPNIILLDEPLSALDFHNAQYVMQAMLRIFEQRKGTVVCVTHDIDDAILLGDRVIVLSKRPGNIVDDIAINLPRPRKLEMRFENIFDTIRDQVYNAMREGMK